MGLLLHAFYPSVAPNELGSARGGNGAVATPTLIPLVTNIMTFHSDKYG